ARGTRLALSHSAGSHTAEAALPASGTGSTRRKGTLWRIAKATRWLIASLLYGAGLRVVECLRLRVKDVDLSYRQILVRDGKGEKDRVTMLPEKLVEPLRAHLGRVRLLAGYRIDGGLAGIAAR
ncbi:MAG: tyrosine-type recombinase/integrase, partial [Burkholderiales bacterium]